MKKNKSTLLLMLLLLLVCLTFSAVGGTYAKYTSSANGTDSISVAKWSIKAGSLGNEKEITVAGTSPTLDFDLFSTVYDEDGGEEKDVGVGVVAPGTSGSFDLSIINDSEVNASYTVSLSENNAHGLPFLYSLDNVHWVGDLSDEKANWDGTNESINEHLRKGKTIQMNGGEDLITVYWKWPFDGDMTKDTNAGISEDENITIIADIIAEQVD